MWGCVQARGLKLQIPTGPHQHTDTAAHLLNRGEYTRTAHRQALFVVLACAELHGPFFGTFLVQIWYIWVGGQAHLLPNMAFLGGWSDPPIARGGLCGWVGFDDFFWGPPHRTKL